LLVAQVIWITAAERCAMKARIGVLLLALLGPFAASTAAGQGGTVSGQVREAGSMRPLGGVQVVVEGTGFGTLTNGAGQYTLQGVTPGTQSLAATSATHTAAHLSVQVTAGGTATVDFLLQPSAVQLDPLVVSASRRSERALEAPARVEVLTAQEIEERPTATPVGHLRGLTGVDIATSGIQSANVVARGFNNVFSGALYVLTDHRIAGTPSLRVNLLHFIPANDDDIERMEVVLGPGSALYGPNTANGVLHILTKSPLSGRSTTASITGGERSLLQGTFRTSQPLSDNFGVKLSAQILRADEWQYRDPVEQSEAAKFASSDSAFWRADLMRSVGVSATDAGTRISRIGNRDFNVSRWGADARADWQPRPDLTAIVSGGTTNSNGIELTGLGAGQTKNWRYSYLQARTSWKRAFAQAYVNMSDAGDTYLLRNGAPIVDKSKLFVAQLQHGVTLAQREILTYGADFLYTVPVTNGTINGIYEDRDETREVGAYLQSETALGPKFDLVLAGRVDSHSQLPKAIFSPRAALVFKPAPDQVFRLTFNRAFSTPSSLNQFLDLGTPLPDAGGARLGYSLRVQGTGSDGFQFRQPDGSYLIRSPFTPAALGGPAQLLPATQARLFWPAAVQVVAAQSAAAGTPLPAQLVAFLAGLNTAPVQLTYFYPASTKQQGGLLSSLAVEGVQPIRESTSNTFEAGYKGLLGTKILLAADVWYSKHQNLVTPLTITTPFVGFDRTTTEALLLPALTQFFQAAGLPLAQAQAQAQARAPLLAGGIAQVPAAALSSPDVNANGAQLLVTYFNVDDDLDLYGTDLSATALLGRDLSLQVGTSLVSQDVFTTRRGDRVTLNAPKRKATVSLDYRNEGAGLNAEGRVRYNAAYPVDSGVYKGTACLGDATSDVEPCVSSYTLLDLTLGYKLPGRSGTTIQLSVDNILNEAYRSFPGSPSIGRLALLRLKYQL
jgi:outer membrane receptor for ferrienterochelin and colicins